MTPFLKEPMMGHEPLTISVPEAGKRYFGLCRNASYDAAARGEIPVIKIGRLLRVPVRALERMLDRLPAGQTQP
jgi:Helix-turn-helix domain